MLKNILKTLQETGDLVMEKASDLNEKAKETINDAKEHTKEKALAILDEWVEILPKLKTMGFELTSFGISMSINPCMLAEMKGETSDFSDEKLEVLLAQYKADKSIKLFLNVVKTTLMLHRKTNAPMKDVLIVRLEVKFSPEIKVFVGRPELT
ncbi:MAG: hypothetical protein H7X99_06245 [Saprospiraceae bacterium]|nr:hypothetical protein [Saprospiraceae bacterium]